MARYAPYIFLGCVACSGSSLFTYLVMNDKKTDSDSSPGPAPNTTDISKPGDTCVPTGTPDPKGTYITNSKGNCDLSRCSVGYSPIDGTCVEEDPTPTPKKKAPAPKKAADTEKKAPAPAPSAAPAVGGGLAKPGGMPQQTQIGLAVGGVVVLISCLLFLMMMMRGGGGRRR